MKMESRIHAPLKIFTMPKNNKVILETSEVYCKKKKQTVIQNQKRKQFINMLTMKAIKEAKKG